MRNVEKEIESSSVISDKAIIYKPSRVISSNIEEKCCVGQDSDLVNVIMKSHSELGRRNLVRNSILGEGTYTGTNTILKNVDIGKYSCISWNVSIGGGNHPYSHMAVYTDYWFNRTFGVDICEEKEEGANRTVIGNDVWIGAGVNILSGITIGDGAVIGSGALVTRDIEPYSVVYGIPAREHKKRFSKEIIELLKMIRWWDWSEEKIVANIELLRSEPTISFLKGLLRDET